MSKKTNPESEWYIYSMVALLAANTLIISYFFRDHAESVGQGFNALLGIGLGLSKRWKNMPDSRHIYVVIVSIIVLLITILPSMISSFLSSKGKNSKIS